MRITIAGFPGSGKSTVSRYLEKKFGLSRYNMGDLRRKMALERGMTIDELNKLGEKESWTDDEVDEYQKKLGNNEDNFVIDGRLSWFFIPNSIKLFLNVDPKMGARRIYSAERKSESKYSSPDETENEIRGRIASDKKRYSGLYGVDPYNLKHFDVIIDTTNLSENEMNTEVGKAIEKLSKEHI